MRRTALAILSSGRKLCLIVVVLFILLSSSLIYCVQASSPWSRIYDRPETKALIGTLDGGYAIAGSFGYTIEGRYTGSGSLLRDDFFLTKIDANGTLQWTQRYGGGERGDAEATSLVQASDGGYVLVGKIADSVRSYDSDVWLVKTDSSGNMEWNRTYSGSGLNYAGDVIQTGDGGYAITGGSYTNGDPRLTEFWLVKTDAYGNVVWNQTYGTPENYETAYSLVESLDGGYALAGTMYNLTDSSIWLVKVDPLGNIEWNQTFRGENGTSLGGSQALVATSDGGYALIGGKTQPVTTSYGAIGSGLLIKTNARGDEEWNRTFGTPGSDDGLGALIQTPDGGYALVGAIGLINPATKGDAWLVKTDSEGNMLWSKTYGGLPDVYGQYYMDRGDGLVQAPDGGYTILAETEYPMPSSALGEARVWLIKTDEAGSAPELSDVYSPTTPLPPIPPHSATPEQPQSLNLFIEILLGACIVVGTSMLTVLPFKKKKQPKTDG